MSQHQISIGPGAIAEAGTSGGPKFALSKPEWIAIQTYVTDVLALPTNDAELRNYLGSGAPKDLSDFDRLIAAYQAMNKHCTTWQKDVFPATVDLASSVYNYGVNIAPVYYSAILPEAEVLKKDPNNKQALAALKAILGLLKKQANEYASAATAVRKQIQTFADQTQADRTTLVGPHGKAGLQKYYNDKYGKTSQDVQEILRELRAQNIILRAADKDYNHDVTVASTTPTYAWIVPVGTIAAAVVAGVYGHRAVEALDRAKAAKAQIRRLEAQRQADSKLMLAIHSACQGIDGIVQALSAALPAVEIIEGVWGAIASDLGSVMQTLEDEFDQGLYCIMNLGVEEATKAWHNVGQEADKDRVNAYVQPSGGSQESMEAWRLRNLLMAPAA